MTNLENQYLKEDLRQVNDDLCDFYRRWKLEADWITCKSCKRNHIASKRDEAFVHAAECKAAKSPMETYPWDSLHKLLAKLFNANAAHYLSERNECVEEIRTLRTVLAQCVSALEYASEEEIDGTLDAAFNVGNQVLDNPSPTIERLLKESK